MKPRKALVPVDGSAFSAQVLPAVRRLLDPATYHLTLVRVAPLPPDVGPVPSPPRPITVDGYSSFTDVYDSAAARDFATHPIYDSQVWESVRAELTDDLADELHSLQEAGFEVSRSVHFGNPAEEIVRLATDGAYDLIVMATHGRSGLRRALLGSVAERVLRSVGVPVLMVRPVKDLADVTLPLGTLPLESDPTSSGA